MAAASVTASPVLDKPTRAAMVRLMKVHRTVIQMMVDRKYLVEEDEVRLFKANDVLAFVDWYTSIAQRGEKRWLGRVPGPPIAFRSALSNTYTSADGKKKCLVYFATNVDDGKEDKRNIRAGAVEIFSNDRTALTATYEGVFESIFIAPGTKLGSPTALSQLELMSGNRIYFDYQLVVNPTRHELTPVQVALDAREKEEILKTVGSVAQLQIMSASDPIAAYYNLAVGTVVRRYNINLYQKILADCEIGYRVVLKT